VKDILDRSDKRLIAEISVHLAIVLWLSIFSYGNTKANVNLDNRPPVKSLCELSYFFEQYRETRWSEVPAEFADIIELLKIN